jgi:IPT/TIG domain
MQAKTTLTGDQSQATISQLKDRQSRLLRKKQMINQRPSITKYKRYCLMFVLTSMSVGLIGSSALAAPDAEKTAPVKEAPQVTRVDHVAIAPGHPLVISGKGFSKTAADNVVTFGKIKAHVTGATETRITCIVPHMHFPTWHVPITVTTNGVPSKEKVTINIDVRIIPNDGHKQL